MITVTIAINGKAILARSAVNTLRERAGHAIYEVDDGTVIAHRREAGAVPLAIKMLKTIKEPGKS